MPVAINVDGIAATVSRNQLETAASSTTEQPPASLAENRDPDAATPELVVTHTLDVFSLVLAIAALTLIVLTRWHRLPRAPQRPNAFSPPTALFVLAMMYLLGPIGMWIGAMIFGITIADGGAAATLAIDDTFKLQCAAMTARLVGVAAFFALVRNAPPLLHDRRASPMAAIALGIAGLLLTWPLIAAAISLTLLITGAAEDPIAHETLRQLIAQPLSPWGWAMIGAVTVVGPLTEEVMYRGLLQEAIRRCGISRWAAIILTSVVFAMAHVNAVPMHGLVGLFILSLGFGWAYEKTGSLWAPFTMHALFNAGNILLAPSAG